MFLDLLAIDKKNGGMGDVVRFAPSAARRIIGDFKSFRKDHALGAFQFIGGGSA